jgi:hypothetical protein
MKAVSMFIRFYFILAICLNGLSLLGKVQPLGHEEIIHFRSTESVAISAEKSSLGTAYDAVAILSLANKRKATDPVYYSRLVQGVCLGYGFKNGVQSSLVPSAGDRRIFQESLESAGEHLLSTSALPTGAAVWNITSENHDRHAAQMAQWLGLRRAGALDMEYRVPAARYPDTGRVVAGGLISPTLGIHDWLGAQRLTNLEIRKGFYDDEFFQVTNCHPYNPTDAADRSAKNMQQPVVIEYAYDDYQQHVPVAIKDFLGAIIPRLYLNVQDNPWNGNQILLRPHAMKWMFESDSQNYGGVRVYAVDDADQDIVNETSSVYPHFTTDYYQRRFVQASPPGVMILKNINHTEAKAFYSVVVSNGMAAVTRHIFLTPEQCEPLQQVFQPHAKVYRADEFAELLTPGWKDFLISMGIPLA